MPQSKPQWLAFLSRADEVFYGGAAGGGKTDLVLGMAVECHQHSAIFRRVYPNLQGVMRRAREIIGSYANENKADKIWSWSDGRTLEFGAVQYEDDKKNWQGRAHDLKAFDEITEFTKSQYEFICGWNRTTDPGQRVRVIVTGNPPTDDAGSWVTGHWSAWLDKTDPHPAKPGELRWYATVDGQECEFPDGTSVTEGSEIIYPRSRTFIPAKLDDNPFLAHDDRYRSVLQSLPEPLRSILLKGDFYATATPDPWQVIPTDWIRQAQRRWLEREKPTTPLTAAGIDPARGGRDHASMSKRYDNWFDEIVAWPGSMMVDGPAAAELERQSLGDERPGYINIDVIGYGSSNYDSLKVMYSSVNPINAAAGSQYRDRSGQFKMRNVRAEYYWRFREALDPMNGDDVALPPGNDILADLCAAHYKSTTAGIQIEEKEEIKKRLGRSPDKGESILLCNFPNGGGLDVF